MADFTAKLEGLPSFHGANSDATKGDELFHQLKGGIEKGDKSIGIT
jgi:hypothetical protein